MPENDEWLIANKLRVEGQVTADQATGAGQAVVLGEDGKVPADLVPSPDMTGYVKDSELATVAKSGSYNDLQDKPSIPAGVVVDPSLSDSSTNPVQNKAVKAAIDAKQDKDDYALKSEIPDVSGFARKTDIPDVSGFETSSHATSTYATKTELTSGLANKVDAVSGSRLMTDAEGVKLQGIAEGAQVNVIETIRVDGTPLTVTGKAVDITMPDAEVTQDADGITVGTTALQNATAAQDGLMTAAQVQALDGKARVISVDQLPTTDIDERALYTVPDPDSDEEGGRKGYVRVNGSWAPLGGSGGGGIDFYIHLTVTASAGSPDLSGIAVTATATGDTATGQTDAEGRCDLVVKQGLTYTITCSKTHYIFESTPTVEVTDINNDAAISCYVAPSITADVGGVDYSGRTVTLTPSTGDPITKVTGPDGTAVFEDLPPETYTGKCDFPAGQGVTPASQVQTVEPGGAYTMTFTVLSKPTLEVTVDSATGNVANRTITATPTEGDTVTAQTNASGVASLTLMADVEYEIGSDSPAGYFAVTSKRISLAAGADSDMTLTLQRKPVVYVTVTDASAGGYEVGRIVQMSGPSDTQTATTVTGGTCSFVANGTGAYIFIITNLPEGASAATVSQTLKADQTYDIAMTISFGWTHSMDFNASTFQTDPTGCLTYSDDAAGFTPVSNTATSLQRVTDEGSWGFDPETGMDPEGLFYATFSSEGVLHQLLDPYDLSKYIAVWNDSDKSWDYSQKGNSSITTENTMICIPTIYTSSSATKMSLSSKPDSGNAKAHTIDGHVYQYLALNVFKPVSSGGKLMSLSGTTATTTQTRAQFRALAQANTVRNGKAMLWNWDMWRLDSRLKYMRAKSFSMQTRVGQGGHSYSTRHNGDTNALGPFAGNISGLTDHVKMLDEDSWGCLYFFVDDAYCSGTNVYVGHSSNPTDDTSNKEVRAVFGFSSGFPNQIQTDDDLWGMGMNGSGSTTTGLCDYQNLTSTTSPVPYVCGNSGDVSDGRAGPACLGRYALSGSNSDLGTRLAFVFDP